MSDRIATEDFVTDEIGAAGGVPTGTIAMFGATSAPTGWLLCNGSAVSRATYATLFALIGTTFGAGDGSTTFNLPDLRDRVPVGNSGTISLGATGGSTTITHSHTLAAPAHTHTLSDNGFAAIHAASGVGIVLRRLSGNYTSTHIHTATGQAVNTESVSRTGGSALGGSTDGASATALTGSISDHTGVRDPYQAVAFIIKD